MMLKKGVTRRPGKIIVWALTLSLCLSTTACFRRLPVHYGDERLEKKRHTLLVRFKSGEEVDGHSELLIRHAVIQKAFLTGDTSDGKVRLPLANISKMELIQADQRRVIIITAAFAVLMAYGAAYAAAISKANVD